MAGNKLQFSGAYGELKKGYRTVATISGWSWDGGGRVHARAADVLDPFWFDRGGLDLRLQIGRKWWEWDGVDADCSTGAAAVTVYGSPRMR